MIAVGNPKNMTGVEDLVRNDIIFINRQKGAGTRVLLDYKLKQSDIDAADISGYEREEYTHMSVAAAVKDGVADAGLGILAAARALKLDFIPVATERYDLAIPGRYFDSNKIQALLSVIRTQSFRDRVMELGGYDTSQTGELVG